MISLYGFLLIALGTALGFTGVLGIWLVMNTPIQLQPIPFIVFVLGVLVVLGGLIVLGARP